VCKKCTETLTRRDTNGNATMTLDNHHGTRWTTDICGHDALSKEPTGDMGNRTAEDSRENEKGTTDHAKPMQHLSHSISIC